MSLFISYSHDPMYKGAMTKIFTHFEMLYADKNLNSLIYYDSTKNIWLDKNDISVGENIDEKIKKGIDGSEYFIIFISNEYVYSEYIREKELPFIFTKIKKSNMEIQKCLIPVVLQGTDWDLLKNNGEELQYFIDPNGEPLFCINKESLTDKDNNIMPTQLNKFSDDLKEKMKGNPKKQNDRMVPMNIEGTDIQKIKDKRFRCNRSKSLNEFKLLIPSINSNTSSEENSIEKFITFFMGSSDQLVNNFIYRIPSHFKEDFELFKVNITNLNRNEFLEPLLRDYALSVQNDHDVIRTYKYILYEIQKFINVKEVSVSEKIIIPVYILLNDEVFFAKQLIDKIKLEMHDDVCKQMKEVQKLGLNKICYFIAIIYENKLKNSDFPARLNLMLTGMGSEPDMGYIKNFEDIKQEDLEQWVKLLREELKTETIKKKILSLCADNRTITMKEFDDYILSLENQN